MKRIFKSLLLTILAVFIFAGTVNAATSVRLEQPGTPTNQDTFKITFVALDTNNNAISVQCFKKAPGDGSFIAFGSPIVLSNGGNTSTCQVNSGIVNTNGTYQFKAEATGGETATSNIVSIDFNNQKPGQPVNYNKEKPDSCTYKISFRTANDSGKTVKVVLYRSTDRTFSLDSGHQVNQVSVGSDTDSSMTDNISPNCNTEYFYAIRAFDIYGNPSDPNGDSSITTTVVNPTGTVEGAQGAIANGTNGNVLGQEDVKDAGKGVLGTESGKTTTEEAKVDGQNPVSNAINWIATHKKISLLVVIILLGVGYYLYRKYYKKV